MVEKNVNKMVDDLFGVVLKDDKVGCMNFNHVEKFFLYIPDEV